MDKVKFQIRFTDKNGCGSFEYFDATYKEALEFASVTANEYLDRRNRNHQFTVRSMFGIKSETYRTVQVVEYNTDTHRAKRGGMKFKLKLRYVQATFADGSKRRGEWYAASESSITPISLYDKLFR